jgi:hypothetical protein
MRNALIAIAAAVTLVSQVSGQEPSPTPAPAKIEITFEGNGVMSLKATNAPLRDILNEWTRKGGTPFVGAERLTGAPLTVEYPHKPETEVVASLLRSASGFVVGPRQAPSSAASSIEVVYVLATSTATTGGFSPAPAYAPPPPPTTQGNPSTEIPPIDPGRAGQAGSPPAQPEAPPPPRPSGIGGVAVPVITVPVSSSTPPPAGTTGTGPGRGGGPGR